jgi:hypothetical protein
MPPRRAPIELLHQLKTRSYLGAKLRPGVSDPRAKTTLDLRPLDHAKAVGPCREAMSSVVSEPTLAAMTPAQRRRIFRVAAAVAPINFAERWRRQDRKPLGIK